MTCCNCSFSSPVYLLFFHQSCGEPRPTSVGFRSRAFAAHPSAQTSSEEPEHPVKQRESYSSTANHHVVHRNTHDAGWRMGKAKRVVEDAGGHARGHARGQATSGIQLDIYYRRCPPSLRLAWIPRKGSETPIGGLQGALGSRGNCHWGGDDPRVDSPLACMGKEDQC